VIEGAVIAAVFTVIGYLLGQFRRPAGKPVKAICSCGDPRGQHVDGKGRCQAKHTKYSDLHGTHLAQCTCQIYDGPEPISGYYAPEIQS
jgi:hypothetical protein